MDGWGEDVGCGEALKHQAGAPESEVKVSSEPDIRGEGVGEMGAPPRGGKDVYWSTKPGQQRGEGKGIMRVQCLEDSLT